MALKSYDNSEVGAHVYWEIGKLVCFFLDFSSRIFFLKKDLIFTHAQRVLSYHINISTMAFASFVVLKSETAFNKFDSNTSMLLTKSS